MDQDKNLEVKKFCDQNQNIIQFFYPTKQNLFRIK